MEEAKNFKIIRARKNREQVESCLAIARVLPAYFAPGALTVMARDLTDHRLYIALEQSRVVGFAALYFKNEKAAELSWIAVSPEEWGSGVGTALLERLCADLAGEGCKLLQVKTLDAKAGYQPYEATRFFYEKRGFIQLDTINPYPGWEPGNPCAIYVKMI